MLFRELGSNADLPHAFPAQRVAHAEPAAASPIDVVFVDRKPGRKPRRQ